VKLTKRNSLWVVDYPRFLSRVLRWQKEQRSTIRQNKLNSLILRCTEHERLREIDTTSVINKFAVEKSRKCNLK